MKKTGVVMMILLMLGVTGCGSSVETVKKTDADAPLQTEADNAEADEPEENIVYTVGDRILFDDEYALTIISVKETEERNEFSEKEVEQVLIIEYLYENLGSEDEIYISEMEFKLVDEGGNMMDTYPVEASYSPEYTPKGAKTLASFAVGTTAKSEKIDMHYYDNFFSSQSDCTFSLSVGDVVDVSMEGVMPEYDNTFKLGEIIEVSTDEGEYTVAVDSVRKTDERNEFEKRKPEAVYEIEYTYSNISMDDPVYITEYSFTLIDEHGNTGYSYPLFSDVYPSETVKGARSKAVIYLAAHKDSASIILTFKDNLFNSSSDFYIRFDGIN